MAIARALGHAKIEFYHCKEPASTLSLKLRPHSTTTTTTTQPLSDRPAQSNGSASSPSSTSISFPDLVRSIIPPCQLNPFLFNGHLQTFYTAVKGQDVPIHYRRRVFEQSDPKFRGSFAVDFVVSQEVFLNEKGDTADDLPPRTRLCSAVEMETMDRGVWSDDSKPMLVILHGLSGGSHELYLRHVIAKMMPPDQKTPWQWEACVVNSRGCAGSRLTSGVLYNARSTWDLRQMVGWLREKFPNRPLFGVGFSLGGNILTNYLGEEGDRCELKAAMVLSNPWNLEIGSMALQRSFLGLHVYSTVMGTNMKALVEKHAPQIREHTKVDVDKVRTLKYLHEFDRHVQGPTWGYPTEGAYYRDSSSVDSVFAVKIPLLAVNAVDDPIAVNETLPRLEVETTPNVVLCTTSLGGHLSWFELGGDRWYTKAAAAFFNKMAFEVDLPEMVPKIDSDVDSTQKATLLKPVFDPMRRSWYFAGDQADRASI